MGDKFPSTVNAFINFVAGEQPTADKFNALVAQTKYGFAGLEAAIGDIHNASWPYIADTSSTSAARLTIPFFRNILDGTAVANADKNGRFLDISNIARLIGPASNLNPLVLTEATTIINEAAGVSGANQFCLKYPISGTIGGSNPAFTNDAASALVTYKTSLSAVTADGDYYVSRNGNVYTYKAISSGLTATYTTDASKWASGASYSQSRFNVIPDPNQVSSGSVQQVVVNTAAADGLHVVQLPLITHQQVDKSGTTATLSAAKDLNYNIQAKLPFAITQNLSVGQTIPAGFLYLKNVSKNEVYTDAVYIYNNEYTFQVGEVDLDSAIAAGDTFQVLTIGTDITSAILDLQYKFFNHTHDRSFGEGQVDVGQLTGVYDVEAESGVFMPSSMRGNHFAQYLHRDGYRPTAETTVANDDNALRGHLVFGLTSGTPGNYVIGSNSVTDAGGAADTFGICFGGNPGATSYPDNTYGPVIYGEGSIFYPSEINLNIKSGSERGDINLISSNWIDCTADQTFRVTAGENLLLSSTGGVCSLSSAVSSVGLTAATNINLNASEDVVIRSGTGGIGDGSINLVTAWNEANTGVRGVSVFGSRDYYQDYEDLSGSLFFVKGFRNSSQNKSLVQFWNEGIGTVLDLVGTWDQEPVQDNKWIKFWSNGSSTDKGYLQGSIRQSNSNKAFYNVDNGSYHNGALGANNAQYVSGAADYAEWIECGDILEWSDLFDVEDYEAFISERKEKQSGLLGLPEGIVVFVRDDKPGSVSMSQFYRHGPGRPMIITSRAMIVGNEVGQVESDKLLGAHVSFIGQVPVVIEGKCDYGDFIILSKDNICKAVPQDQISFSDYKSAIGTSFGKKTEEETGYVVVGIGVK